MKISSLFEAVYPITYDSSKKKNTTSVLDFIKQNNISKEDLTKVYNQAIRLQEYKKILALGFIEKTTKLQQSRSVLFFEHENGQIQITAYPTGQAREAKRVGHLNNFMASPIPTLPPEQLKDDSDVIEVLLENVKRAMQSLLSFMAKRKERARDGEAATAERMKNLGLGEFKVYKTGAPKDSKFVKIENGEITFTKDAWMVTVDFGNLPSIPEGFYFAENKTNWRRIEIKGNNIKSYKGLENLLTNNAVIVSTKQVNFKAMAKEVKNVRFVTFKEDPSTFPVLSIIDLFKNSAQSNIRYVGLSTDNNVNFRLDGIAKEVVDILNSAIINETDPFDVQEQLIEIGAVEAAKL